MDEDVLEGGLGNGQIPHHEPAPLGGVDHPGQQAAGLFGVEHDRALDLPAGHDALDLLAEQQRQLGKVAVGGEPAVGFTISLAGRTALVTGASAGLGANFARVPAPGLRFWPELGCKAGICSRSPNLEFLDVADTILPEAIKRKSQTAVPFCIFCSAERP